ncbi:hypothetical protein K435DRAFT_717243 [Dendrothele bispora CBS 962.96]|uniref:BRCT domain-containing protein n=1 Tax=Dendrothele bispora (strain CBS 962.96) TaxID=1314807 RepID=A0A4S8MI61_DENBC|nr:hypothetical protein K435DRAFT_717243 [Dendrothele bispora CBS 962.96]
MLLFENVKYHLSESLSSEAVARLAHVLNTNGATRAQSLQDATHVITNSNRFEGWQNIPDTITVVTEKWVDRSMVLGKPQSPVTYSPDPAMIFSGVVGCATDIQDSDVEIISAGITALGGQWRSALSKDVTHLFAITPGSAKYESAMLHKEQNGIKTVLPHWFDDSVRLGLRNLETEAYEWPEPSVLKAPSSPAKRARRADPDREALYKSSTIDISNGVPQPFERDIFGERRVLLSSTLELGERKEAVGAGIERTGGLIVECDDMAEEIERVDECDILVTKYRSGKAYFKAVKAGKTIGTLAWLFHVQSVGVLTRPLDQLLHYPIPNKPIEDFSSHEITISNYTGEAREYLKKLIVTMGAVFTPSMSSRNTVLIAAYNEGQKAVKAATWSIPVVNHLWLEDCFIKWKNLTVGQEKYLDFSSGADFSIYLGRRGVGSKVEDLDEIIRLELEEEEEQQAVRLSTQHSAKDATEVAKLIQTDDQEEAGAAMDLDEPVPVSNRSPVRSTYTSPKRSKQQVSSASSSKRNNRKEDTSETVSNSKKSRKPSKLDAKKVAMDVDLPQPDHADKDARSDIKAKGKNKSRREKQPREKSDVVEASVSKPSRKTPVKARKDPRESTDEEGPASQKEDSPPSPSHGKKIIRKPTVEIISSPNTSPPKRTFSVMMPGMKLVTTPAKPNGTSISPQKTSLATRNDSVHIASHERRRPSTNARAGPSNTPLDSSPMSTSAVSRTSKRAAASRASQRLHEEVMPDVLNYQQEMKRKGKGRESIDAKKRRASSSAAVTDIDEEEMDRPKPVNKEKSRTSQNNPSAKFYKNDKSNDSRGLPAARKRKSAGEAPEQSDTESVDEDSSTRPSKKRKVASGRTAEGDNTSKSVKLMTTQVKLSNEDVEALKDLGVKMTTKPSECTHLVAPQLVRTEKFLCALARSPYILTPNWVHESISAGKLLSEDRYRLKDSANEKKYDVRLADALARAKEKKGTLFKGKRFYITGKVEVSYALLKNVVEACGGQVTNQTPTARILDNEKGVRYVISCPKDATIWRPIADTHPIYTSELVLSGVLKQDVEWDNDEYKVAGSF